MKKLILFLMLCFISAPLLLTAQTVTKGHDFAAYEILIELNDTLSRAQVNDFLNENNLVVRKSFKYLKNTFVVRIKGKEKQGKEIAKTDEERQIVSELITKLRSSDLVVNVEANFKIEVELQETARIIPNDPDYNIKWGLEKINAPEAWATRTRCDLKIGLIDDGTDINHVDLIDNIWQNPIEVEGDANNDGFPGIVGIDDDGDGLIDEDSQGLQPGETGYSNDLLNDDDENGYPDDFNGWDITSNTNDITPNSHGTHTAGIIGATGNNTTAAVGVAWDVDVVPLRISLNAYSITLVSDILEAFEYAKANKIKILSNSWHCPTDSRFIYNTIENFGNGENGILFVFAAGNDSFNNDITSVFPCSYDLDNIIVVAATDNNDDLTGFSNFGLHSVDIAAPGLNIYSTYWENSGTIHYKYLSGTSMACPFVAGAAGLIWSQVPDSSWRHIKSILLASVDHKQQLSDKILSGGRLNLKKAIDMVDDQNVPPIVDAGPSVLIPLDSLNVQLNGTVSDNTLLNGSPLYFTWKKESGPGDVMFENQTSLSTKVWFSEPGRYTLRLAASDGEFLGSDVMVVHISAFEHVGDILTEHNIHDIDVEGNFAYAALYNTSGNSEGISIFDISDPLNPELRSTYLENSGLTTDIEVNGNYIYAQNYMKGMSVVDVSDKDNPIEVGNIGFYEFSNSLNVIGDQVYLGLGNGLKIIDVTNKANPQQAGEINKPNTLYTLVKGNNAYISTDSNLFVYDITTPANPLLLDSFPINTKIKKFAVQYPYILLTTENELRTLYIKDNQLIQIYSNSHENIIDIGVLGNLVYCADKGMVQLYDLAQRSPTKAIDNYGMPYINSIHVEGNRVYGVSNEFKRIFISKISQINTAPYVYAGIDQTIEFSEPVYLKGFVEDDQFPVGSSLEINWEKLSGPGNSIFKDVHQAVTTATFDQAGTYKLQLSANDGLGSLAIETLNVIVSPDEINKAPYLISDINIPVLTVDEPSFSIDVSGYFKDPEGGTLTFDAESGDDDVAAIWLEGTSTLVIQPYGALYNYNTTQLIIRAYDPAGNDLEYATPVVVNHAPEVTNPIPDYSINMNSDPISIDLNTVFTDEDGDALYFYAYDHDIVSFTIEDGTLTFEPIGESGTIDFWIHIEDGHTEVGTSFRITIQEDQYTTEYQAEDGTWSNAEVEKERAGYTGTGYVNTENNSGEWIEFTANVAASGIYKVGARYANAGSARSMDVVVNGSVVSSGSFNGTGGWTIWETETIHSLALQAGANTIRFVATNSYGAANFDKIDLYSYPLKSFAGLENIESVSNITAYPNPMHSYAIIEFTLSADANVKAVLYNALGQQIDILSNDYLGAGLNTIVVNNKNYKAGIYSVKLVIDNNMSIVKQLCIEQ